MQQNIKNKNPSLETGNSFPSWDFCFLLLEPFEPPLCLGMARIEGERLSVIGDSCFFHSLLLALLAHDDILRG